ncbi:MAG: hypothetical protein AAGG75_28495, partial [Bacteroidota bacterium]
MFFSSLGSARLPAGRVDGRHLRCFGGRWTAVVVVCVICNGVRWLRTFSRLTTFAVYRLPSTVYRLPSTVYRLPSTVYRLPSTVYRLPSTVYRLPST